MNCYGGVQAPLFRFGVSMTIAARTRLGPCLLNIRFTQSVGLLDVPDFATASLSKSQLFVTASFCPSFSKFDLQFCRYKRYEPESG